MTSDVGGDGVGQGLLILDAENDFVVAVDEEVGGQHLHAVGGGDGRAEHDGAVSGGEPLAVAVVDADPRQVVDGHAPVVLVLVHADLVDLEALGSVLLVDFAQGEDAQRGTLLGVGAETQQHHLALQVGEFVLGAVGVGKVDVDDVGLGDLILDGTVLDGTDRTRVAHALDGDVVEVLRARGLGVEEVEVRGYGCEGLDILARADGVEDEAAAQTLEQREVGVGLRRVGIDVLHADIVLVVLDEGVDLRTGDAHLGTTVAHEGLDGVLQLDLLQHEVLQTDIVFRALDLIGDGHGGVGGVDLDGLRGVDAQVDELALYAKAVEVVTFGAGHVETEGAIVLQLDGVGNRHLIYTQRIEVEHLARGLGDRAFYRGLRFVVIAANQRQSGKSGCKKCRFFHIFLIFAAKLHKKSENSSAMSE